MAKKKDGVVKEKKVVHICRSCGKEYEVKDDPYLCGKCGKCVK